MASSRISAASSSCHSSDQCFAYYKQPDSLFPIHFVALSDILLVQLLTDQKKGCRFDVVTSHRVMQLMADSPKVSRRLGHGHHTLPQLPARETAAREGQQSTHTTARSRAHQPYLNTFWQQGMGYTTAGLPLPLHSVWPQCTVTGVE